MFSIICSGNELISVPAEVVAQSELLAFLNKQSKGKPVQFNMLGKLAVQDCIQIACLLKDDHPIIERPLRSNFINDYLSDKITAAFKKLANVYEMIDAADVLGLIELFDVGCLYVGFELKNKSSEQIREMYQIADDFSVEERKKINNYFGVIKKIFN